MFYRIESNYFVAGLEIKNNKVVRTAPIIKYMKGWNTDKVRGYVKLKRWSIMLIDEREVDKQGDGEMGLV